jgi:hypothetical protein
MSSAAPLDMDRYSGIWGKCEASIFNKYGDLDEAVIPSISV